MNFLPGRLEENKLRTSLGDLPLVDELRRAIESRDAPRDLIVGVRPESFEDASLVADDAKGTGVTFKAKVDVVESMGSDIFAYFATDVGEAVTSRELEELAQDSGRADTGSSEEQVVARLDAASQIKEGTDAQLWLDARSVHVFDPSSGQNIGLANG
jgi:multiple sugar transport system ATP-binding protein